MRDGKLYKHIIGNSELPPNLKSVFEAWLDSAYEDLPKDPLSEDYAGRLINWLIEYFGQPTSGETPT